MDTQRKMNNIMRSIINTSIKFLVMLMAMKYIWNKITQTFKSNMKMISKKIITNIIANTHQ